MTNYKIWNSHMIPIRKFDIKCVWCKLASLTITSLLSGYFSGSKIRMITYDCWQHNINLVENLGELSEVSAGNSCTGQHVGR